MVLPVITKYNKTGFLCICSDIMYIINWV